MNSVEIKLNLIIKMLNQIMKILEILLKSSNHDLDPDMIKSLINQSDHDQSDQKDHKDDLQDHDLINWYRNFLKENGVDPENRNYESCLRSIRFFYNKFDEIKNPFKYQRSFMPEKIEKYKPDESQDLNLIFGLDASLVESKCHLLNKEIVEKVKEQNPRLVNLDINNILKDPPGMFTKIFTAKAILQGLISKE